MKNYSDWTSRQIRYRADKLAELALKVWILPEKYNSPAAADSNIFTLDSDFRNFTNTAPANVSISNKEYKIDYWIDLLRRVAQELYNIDETIFKQAIQDERLKRFFSTVPENLTSPYKIDENFYVGVGGNTQTYLKCTKFLVENFDSLSDANFKDEIWFTLKNS